MYVEFHSIKLHTKTKEQLLHKWKAKTEHKK